MERILPGLPLVYSRDQFELVADFLEQSDLDFAAARDFVRERL